VLAIFTAFLEIWVSRSRLVLSWFLLEHVASNTRRTRVRKRFCGRLGLRLGLRWVMGYVWSVTTIGAE